MSVEHIQGLDELKVDFARIANEAGAKVLRKGAGAGAQVVKAFVAAGAPTGKSTPRHVAGTLKRSVRAVFAREDSNDNQAVYRVTFHKGKAAQGRLTRKGAVFTLPTDAFYAPWVERGHKIVPRKGTTGAGRTLRRRREQSTAVVPPHRFMEPAFNAAKEPATAAMISAMGDEMQKVLTP
jgi:HK97 gp10 family phage protein